MPWTDSIISALGGSATIASALPDEIAVIPTGYKELDNHVMGCGGLPRGRAIELYAAPSVGKSTVAYNLIGALQRQGLKCALFDAEKAYTKSYGAACGINNDELVLPEFGSGEDMLYKMKVLIALDVFDAIFLDSMNAVSSQVKVDSDDINMRDRLSNAVMFKDFSEALDNGFKIKPLTGLQSKDGKFIESNKVRTVFDPSKSKVVAENTLHKLADKKCCLIIINHEMKRIGKVYGVDDYTPGGSRKEFLFSIRLRLTTKKTETSKSGDNRVLKYKRIQVLGRKNKVGVPLRTCDLLLYPSGEMTMCGDTGELEETEAEVTDQETINNTIDEQLPGDKAKKLKGLLSST